MDRKAKVNFITKNFIQAYKGERIFGAKGFNPAYFPIRAHFNKQDEVVIDMLMAYFENVDMGTGEFIDKSLTELYKNAKNWIRQENDKYIKEETKKYKAEISKYKEFSLEDVLNL